MGERTEHGVDQPVAVAVLIADREGLREVVLPAGEVEEEVAYEFLFFGGGERELGVHDAQEVEESRVV